MSSMGAVFAVGVLVLLAVAALGAASYALFGTPRSATGKKRKREIVNGFQLAGGILLGIALMGSLVACSQIAFGIAQPTKLSRPVAFLVALTSGSLIFFTIRRWAKYFAGWVGYSVLNGLLMTTSGHLVNNPSILVPRWWSISVTVVIFISALVSLRFSEKYALNAVDKVGLMAWVVAFTSAVDLESTQIVHREALSLAVMAVACVVLVIALWHRRRAHHHSSRHSQLHPSPSRPIH